MHQVNLIYIVYKTKVFQGKCVLPAYVIDRLTDWRQSCSYVSACFWKWQKNKYNNLINININVCFFMNLWKAIKYGCVKGSFKSKTISNFNQHLLIGVYIYTFIKTMGDWNKHQVQVSKTTHWARKNFWKNYHIPSPTTPTISYLFITSHPGSSSNPSSNSFLEQKTCISL